jgi:hypothetical protein
VREERVNEIEVHPFSHEIERSGLSYENLKEETVEEEKEIDMYESDSKSSSVGLERKEERSEILRRKETSEHSESVSF